MMVSPAPEREKGLGAGETEACLSNYIWLQMSNNGELLDMDLNFNLSGWGLGGWIFYALQERLARSA